MTNRIFWEQDNNYKRLRIPGMTVTRKGTVLAYFEARREAGDWSDMDILLYRSTDRGESFSAPVKLAAGSPEHPTVNNPVMVEDKDGVLHFIYMEDYTIRGGGIFHRTSTDDGITWSERTEITAYANPDFHNAFALGPGHGIRASDGTLLFTCWMVPKHYKSAEKSHNPSVLSTFYSRDNGKTWQLGEILPEVYGLFSPNEAEIAQLPDGRIYLNCRICGFEYRGRAYSKTGFSDWTGYEADTSLPDPHCFASTITYALSDGREILLFSNCASKSSRKNVTLSGSFDGGKKWELCRMIDESNGGYVEMNTDGKYIYILYEHNAGEKMSFVRLTEKDIV